MTVKVEIGVNAAGAGVAIDLEELLATRLLVQGNSGSGKSHLLRRLLEKSAGQVQQVVVDPEGDFTTLADAFGHIVVDAADFAAPELVRFAARAREHRASVVLNLEGLDAEAQMRSAAAFLGGLFDAPREHWYPALVVVDEAQVFAPSGGGEVAEDVRRASLGAMTNLMCRGRKRGLAGVIATQRLAKLAKNVAAEASNFLMGRTFLDIDMARAADLLGMERRQAEAIRDLQRGHFLALGPAISRRPIAVTIGAVETAARGGGPKLTPLPTLLPEAREALFQAVAEPVPPPPPPPPAPSPERVIEALAEVRRPEPVEPDAVEIDAHAVTADVLRAIVTAPEAEGRPAAMLYQDYCVRCRIAGVRRPPLDAAGFARRLAAARAGIFDSGADEWASAMRVAGSLPDDMLGAFLFIARAAREGLPTPSDEEVARVYGTTSLGRARRVLGYIEERDAIVTRTDLAGKRSITVPALGWTTQAA